MCGPSLNSKGFWHEFGLTVGGMELPNGNLRHDL
jgi:hypothetical protein